MSLVALYVCYLPIDEPLVHTQVVPYLRGLADAGHRIHLLTFDTRRADRATRARLRDEGISWHHVRYHRRPRLLATALDIVVGTLAAGVICLQHRVSVIHARSHVPAAMGVALGAVLRRRLVFDVRGLLAEEYVDAGVWAAGSTGFLVTKAIERVALRRADGVVVLTEKLRSRLVDETGRSDIVVIPCCADIEAITAQRGRRDRVRAELGVTDRPVLLYLGKFGGWYMDDETVAFFQAAQRVFPGLFFLVLTQSERRGITRSLVERGVSEDDFRVARVPPSDVAASIAAGDFAVSFVRAAPSKIASSPTKIGEYLAGGLPVVTTAGVGDVDSIVRGADVGVVVEDTGEAGLCRAASAIAVALDDAAIRARCLRAAEEHLSLHRVGIPRYRALYESIERHG